MLGLQGDVREHLAALEAAGATPMVVKKLDELQAVDGLVIPGGESTTIGKLLDRFDLLEPLTDRITAGMPTYGTCAGAILLAKRILGPEDAPLRVPVLDIAIRRNAYGRQIDSFEADLTIQDVDEAFRAVFIRAPVIEEVGERVEVLARWDDSPVLVRHGSILASTFHPEMTGDARVHRMFIDVIEENH